MLIMNCLDDESYVTVGGNTFHFKPRQIKVFHNEDIGSMITRLKSEYGFVALPEELSYIANLPPGRTFEDSVSEEHKDIIEVGRKAGIENYVKRLRTLVYNAQVSLDRDMKRADFKHDVRVEYSKGDIENIKELVKYQGKKEDETQSRIDLVKELEKKLSSKS